MAASCAVAILLTVSAWATAPDAGTPDEVARELSADGTSLGAATAVDESVAELEPPEAAASTSRGSGASPMDPAVLLAPVEFPVVEYGRLPSEMMTGAPRLESVDGIVVHERLAPILRTLLAEAEVADVVLSGGGFRDRAAQRRLREQNCPDPVASAPSECTPATARVGESFHQSGLAIDFTSHDGLIVDRSHPAYLFLEANSGWTGLAPHPTEPWHWSYRG